LQFFFDAKGITLSEKKNVKDSLNLWMLKEDRSTYSFLNSFKPVEFIFTPGSESDVRGFKRFECEL